MTIQETRDSYGFGGATRKEERVRVLSDGETMPLGAAEVPDETPVHDWQEVK